MGVWGEPPLHRPAQMQSYTSFHSCKSCQGKRGLCKAVLWEGVLRAGWHSSSPKELSVPRHTGSPAERLARSYGEKAPHAALSGDGTAVPDGPTLEQHGGGSARLQFPAEELW